MKQWFYFNPIQNTDIHDPNNYSSEPIVQSRDNPRFKLQAILTDKVENNKPVIDKLELNLDFIRSVHESKNIGMVVLNKEFIKKETWFNKLTDKLINIL